MLQNKIILLKDSQMIKIKTKPNTDNMGKLFVTLFAFCSYSLDRIVLLDKPGPRYCPQ